MEFLSELLFGLLFEVPVELMGESRRLRTWVRTVVYFLVLNALTVVLLIIAADFSHDPQAAGDAASAMYFAIGWFAVSVLLCVIGHRSRWGAAKTCSLKPPAEVEGEPVIRTASMADLDAIARVEAECFPAAEAATREEFAERLTHYAGHFWLMFEGGRLISFVDGFVTDEPDLRDEMYADASLHDPAGAWQMIFGVNTVPSRRRRGYAGQLIRRAIGDARAQGRKGLVLTCKPEKVAYYAKFGFTDEGVSQNSTHGGVVWHQMRLTF